MATPAAASRSRDWVSLAKPGIVVSNVMTAAAGLWVAPGAVGVQVAVAALVGTGLLVAGSGAFNQVLERDTDALMARTSSRPLASRRLVPLEAVILGVLAVVAGAALLAVSVNALSAALGLCAVGIYAFVYTPLKRRTFWAVPVGAVAGALPPVMGWTAVTGGLDAGAAALFAILFWWQVPHFLGIALYRARDYHSAGLAIAPGAGQYRTTVWWVRVGSVLTLVCALALPVVLEVGWLFAVVATAGVIPLVVAFKRVDYADVAGWGRRVFLASLVTLPLLALAALGEHLLR